VSELGKLTRFVWALVARVPMAAKNTKERHRMRIKKIAGFVIGTSALFLAYPASPASAVNNI
jgi:hypothetical protein